MKTQHSLISPSNFERRMLCPGSLNAEKDLPEQTSKAAEEGTMLHERTALYIKSLDKKDEKNSLWDYELTEDQVNAVKHAGDYVNKLKAVKDTVVLYEGHEKTYSLSFIYHDMKGTADSVLVLKNLKTQDVTLHVIDYKFGKGVVVDAFENYQLLMYTLGALDDVETNSKITGNLRINLHIVQPYIRDSNWELSDDEKTEFLKQSALDKYTQIAKACYKPNAHRIASKKACQFCKAKSTCPALAKFVPNTKTKLGELSDEQIGAIYDNKDLINMYIKSAEEYIKNKLEQGSFLNYALRPKLSNRKWNDGAYDYLVENLNEEAFEVNKKLITITKAEKLLGKEEVNKLTIREEGDNEIVKISDESKEIFKTFNND
jgi:hypothetical protein